MPSLTYRPRLVAFLTGLVAVVAAATVAAGASTPPAELDAMMDRLIHDEPAFRDLALAEVTTLGHPAAVPGLIDVLYFDLVLDSRIATLLDRLTGQAFGHDWRQWVEWLQKQPGLRPHRDYAAWKGRLLARIDPAFAQFLPPGVKHRVRLEEIAWGGVRKDAIPAITNPRQVRPAQRTT